MFRPTQISFLRSSLRHLASASNQPIPPGSEITAPVRRTAATILPPIKLYRRLLRAHRKLDADMRAIGDNYIKDEFQRHKGVDNPLQIVGFLSSWKMYLDQLEMQQGKPGGFRGERLDAQLLEKMSDEQIYQIHELMTATQEAYSEKAQARPPGKNHREMAEKAAAEAGVSIKKNK
ncbi:related to ACN9 - protein of gluconeogenesis in mitochondrial intermembrane space [Melanopsichium pennsylvanicum]|uniref:Succinate dehydrogenase assembly factor 3 n=2 Tax=Melanopsichium pennsylvanicum TaxID=63383 RepID=A0AAJ4XPC6_9BASI|nr:related to ACN9-protein of gluconeogenesis in mitochondrial intermembrane space [Melanopsichium pennsylvanicum 4]SNX85476.1 related to ACN9 - protein of gluconeogenesis in mitochondrial intermembrane space [Melanopsichium pennsylvanicum]